ncbi:tetratricopeptide repeat protein [Demetria terragena]|uniref:tetratricopeptide repeat protein n=1 Tax=Demetria terragena TaxID=63959 RepID=UPI000368F79B|nr:tetratricopeptide repeat protein [Demetria terragena]
MTTFESLLSRHTDTQGNSDFAAWQRAVTLFDERRYTEAVKILEPLVTTTPERPVIGTASARLLLARAYFHSAQLSRAIELATAIVQDDPADGYARLLLSRALQRAGRTEEATGHQRLIEAMGVA